MNQTITLPSGKLIDLSRFVALLPAEDKYQLSLAGANATIDLDTADARYLQQQLSVLSNNHNSPQKEQWDKAAQLRKNQPLMQLIEQWQEQKKAQTATEWEIEEYYDIQESLKKNRLP